MPAEQYDELQVEDTPNLKRNYKRLGIITSAIILGCVVIIVLATTVPNSGKGNSSDIPYFAFSNNSNLLGPGPAAGIPCIIGSNLPTGCKQRFVPCGTTTDLTGVKATIPPNTGTACKQLPTLFYIAKKECWEIKMEMGECWGAQPNNKNIFSCQGKCGAGCGNIDCGAWARDCLRHDVCSWYCTASGGGSDPNCGESYNLAADDFLQNCACNASGSKDRSLTSLCP